MSHVPYDREIIPPSAREPFIDPKTGLISISALQFLQQVWSWVVPAYGIIPCEVGGTADAIELTPRLRPEHGGSGYAHGLPFFFVATATSTGAVTIQVKSLTGELAAVPAYLDTTAAGSGDVVAERPYLAIYCEAVADGTPPARFVLK